MSIGICRVVTFHFQGKKKPVSRLRKNARIKTFPGYFLGAILLVLETSSNLIVEGFQVYKSWRFGYGWFFLRVTLSRMPLSVCINTILLSCQISNYGYSEPGNIFAPLPFQYLV